MKQKLFAILLTAMGVLYLANYDAYSYDKEKYDEIIRGMELFESVQLNRFVEKSEEEIRSEEARLKQTISSFYTSDITLAKYLINNFNSLPDYLGYTKFKTSGRLSGNRADHIKGWSFYDSIPMGISIVYMINFYLNTKQETILLPINLDKKYSGYLYYLFGEIDDANTSNQIFQNIKKIIEKNNYENTEKTRRALKQYLRPYLTDEFLEMNI